MKQQLPKGLRHVLVREDNKEEWEERIFLHDLGKQFEWRYECVTKGCEDKFINGEKLSETMGWRYMKEIEEPKKIPYTAEKFPVWAVWMRGKNWEPSLRSLITEVGLVSITVDSFSYNFNDVDKIEIASAVPNEDGSINWKPFYLTE